jgi:hypothetical protein
LAQAARRSQIGSQGGNNLTGEQALLVLQFLKHRRRKS